MTFTPPMRLIIYATFVISFLPTLVFTTSTGIHRHQTDLLSSSSHPTGVHRHPPNLYAHDDHFYTNHKRLTQDEGHTATPNNDINGGARVADVITVAITARAPGPSDLSTPPTLSSLFSGQVPAPSESGDGNQNARKSDPGPLIGALAGTIPIVIALVLLRWRRAYTTRRDRANSTSRVKSEVQHVRVRPKIYETTIEENAPHCDIDCIRTWKDAHPLSVTRIECSHEETSPNHTSSRLHLTARATSDIAVAHYVTYCAIRMPHAHTTPLLEPAFVGLELGVSIIAESCASRTLDARRGDCSTQGDPLRTL